MSLEAYKAALDLQDGEINDKELKELNEKSSKLARALFDMWMRNLREKTEQMNDTNKTESDNI